VSGCEFSLATKYANQLAESVSKKRSIAHRSVSIFAAEALVPILVVPELADFGSRGPDNHEGHRDSERNVDALQNRQHR